MSDADFRASIIAVAATDPPLASALLHIHDCVENVKAVAKEAVQEAVEAKRTAAEVRVDIARTLHVTVATLVSFLAFVLWEVIVHGLRT